jgi:hypothetical protein
MSYIINLSSCQIWRQQHSSEDSIYVSIFVGFTYHIAH